MFYRLFGLCLLTTAFASCSDATASASDGSLQGKLTLTGSSTVAPLVLEIGKRFENLHPGVRVDVQTGGSSRGIADAGSGLADIGMASRALKVSEAESLDAHAIAQDGVALIVHTDNPLTTLPAEQVASIYRGAAKNWSAVGGNDAPITVVNKASGRATLEVFLKHFELAENEIRADVVIGDNEQGIKTVAGNPDSIGYVSIGAAEYNAKNGVPIRLLSAGGVEATTANVGAGRFPIGRPLNLVTKGELSPIQKAFIDYCRSADVHDIIEDFYFVPIQTTE